MESVEDQEPILVIRNEDTCIATDHIRPVAQTRVVELVVIGLGDVFVAHPDRQPVACVLGDLERHGASILALLL